MKNNRKIILIIVFMFIITGCKSKEKYIYNNEELYDLAVKYIVDNDNDTEKNNYRYKIFTQYEGFGITKDDKYRYVYMWISEESYYVVDNKIVIGSGSSMPYKFVFELDKDNVVKYDTPKDGNEYVSSIKKMYPNDIENKAINYAWKDYELMKDVKEYYSDLNDDNFYYYDGKEYIKLD